VSGGTRTLAELLPVAATQWPDRVAVVDGERTSTYRELDALAARVATALAAGGVQPGDLVGIHLPKSLEAVAVIHAVLRLGAAYVPLDSGAPAARLAVIARDASPRTIVVNRRTARVWTPTGNATASPALLDIADATRARPPDATPQRPVFPPAPDDLAYVLYTSGSTGAPKGVEITHANSLAFVDWAVDAFSLDSADRLAAHAPFHFDLSVFDLFAAASVGAALVLVPKSVSRFPVDQARWIEAERVTVWYSVPTALSLLVTKADLFSLDLSALRLVLFAGEVFPVRHLATLMAAVPHAQHWNLYGPTETNVCTAYHVDVAPDPEGEPVPIGWPVSGDHVRVVGDDDRPVAPGSVGELIVTGPTVAVGYRGAPELTAARFLDSADGPHRSYRTGDRVVADSRGCLRFVGRVDAQVKTRGHRVELGEIEIALLRHPDVDDGVVVAVPDELVTNRLVAFVVATAGREPKPMDILRHLATLLPAAMVPERVMLTAVLPRTSTGKADRALLTSTAARDQTRSSAE
jgi:amino acid adenylation domain-containing protein